MSSLSPEAWEDLINRFETDDALFQKFNRSVKAIDPSITQADFTRYKILCVGIYQRVLRTISALGSVKKRYCVS